MFAQKTAANNLINQFCRNLEITEDYLYENNNSKVKTMQEFYSQTNQS